MPPATLTVIEQFKAEERSILLAAHYIEEAERLCDRVAIIDAGKIIELGTPRALIQSLGGTDLVEFTRDESHGRPFH